MIVRLWRLLRRRLGTDDGGEAEQLSRAMREQAQIASLQAHMIRQGREREDRPVPTWLEDALLLPPRYRESDEGARGR